MQMHMFSKSDPVCQEGNSVSLTPAFCISSMVSAVWSVLSPLTVSVCPACRINPSSPRFWGAGL